MSAATVTSSENIPDFCWWQRHRFYYWYHCRLRSPCITERNAKFFFPFRFTDPLILEQLFLKCGPGTPGGWGDLSPFQGSLRSKFFQNYTQTLFVLFALTLSLRWGFQRLQDVWWCHGLNADAYIWNQLSSVKPDIKQICQHSKCCSFLTIFFGVGEYSYFHKIGFCVDILEFIIVILKWF